MALSLAVAGAAPALSAVGSDAATPQGKPKPPGSLARVVISPAQASIHAGADLAYTAEGYDAAGHDLGDVTAYTRFAMSSGGTCVGATCTADKPARYSVTGTIDRDKHAVSDTAVLRVLPPSATPKPPDQTKASPHPAERATGPAQGQGGPQRRAGATEEMRGNPRPHDAVQAPRRFVGRAAPVGRLVLSPARRFILPGEPVTYTTEAFDAAGRDLGDVTAKTTFAITFSATHRLSARPDGSCVGATCTASKFGRHTVTGTAHLGGGTLVGWAALQVVPRHRGPGPLKRLASLELVPNPAVIEAGARATLAAYGYDAQHHYLGDVTSFTTFSIEAPGSCAGAVCTATKAQGYTVTGTVQLADRAISGTTHLEVVPGPLAKLSLTPPTAVISAGQLRAYRAYGWDAYDNALGEVTAKTVFSVSPDGSCQGASCTATSATPRTHTVTGTVDVGEEQVSGTAELDVLPGPLAKVRIEPRQSTVTAGREQPYLAYGWDAYGNALDKVTDMAVFSIDPDGSCHGSSCGATSASPSTHTVTGTVVVAGMMVSGTAELDVVPGPLTTLSVLPSQSKVTAGQGQRYRAYGSDAFGNSLGEMTRDASFSIGAPGSCTEEVCGATRAQGYTVVATVGVAGNEVGGSAQLDVVPGPLAKVQLDPTRVTVTAGQEQAYRAYGSDKFDNRRGEVTQDASFSIGEPGSCAGRVCTATKAQTYEVSGTVTTADGTFSGTAQMDVTPGPIATLTIDPAEAAVPAGGKQPYHAYGSDSYGNRLDEVTTKTSWSISPNGSCETAQAGQAAKAGEAAQATCTASRLGRHTVMGSVVDGSRTIKGEAPLLVLSSDIVSVRLNPRSATMVAGDKVTYTATGVDGADRAVVDLTDYTRLSISTEGVCAAATCTAKELGDHTVTGSVTLLDRVLSDKVNLRVVARNQPPLRPGGLASLQLSPSHAEVDPGVGMVYHAYGVDRNGTRVGEDELTTGTRFSISPDGSCTDNTCVGASPGGHTVTGSFTVSVPSVGSPSVPSVGPASWRRVADGTVTGGNRVPVVAANLTGGRGAVIVPEGLVRATRVVTGTASLSVRTPAPRGCVPTERDVRSMQLTPRRGPSGTAVRILAKLDPRFAACHLTVLLGGERLAGGEITVGADGTVSGRGTVVRGADGDTSTVSLTTPDGRPLATRSFDIISDTGSGWFLWLLFAIALLLPTAVGAATARRERNRRQRRWVAQHVRTEAHGQPGLTRTDPDHNSPPSIAVRLQPHLESRITEISTETTRD
jgi:hypothetical protein